MSDDTLRWVWRGVAGAVLVIGWLFILIVNNFRFSAPVVVIALAYLAIIAMVINLWRVGTAAVAPEQEGEEAWVRPIGPRTELEKEKKTLLKAIKEAEFDHAMGKLSKADADEMIRTYRARAIEVIKELDRLDAGGNEGARAEIQREVQARLALEKKSKKKNAPAEAEKVTS